MATGRHVLPAVVVLATAFAAGPIPAPAVRADAPAGGVFARFKVVEPREALNYVRLAGYIHKSPWYLKRAVIPAGAERDKAKRVRSGQFTEWFDLSRHAGKLLHGRLHRAGGVAELPNVTADFVCDPPAERRTVVIELATAPDRQHVVRTFRETFTGSLTSFLVSPQLARDAGSLETAAQMTQRRLQWARKATGGRRSSPKRLIVQTSFWAPQRPELNVKEADVLWLLGFNVVGNQQPEVRRKLAFRVPGHTHQVRFVFYYTTRFRQAAATQRVRWHTEAFHKHFRGGARTSTLVADHPYFGGTGLGMGMKPNSTWGGAPLAMDWFDLARRRAVDLIGIEDWMGLQYMYGPNATWEGFQLMGFQAAIFRSASRGTLPIIAWITPSDETNLRLKTASGLCQGAKHFFYWTYGPTATSTENYWSDLRSAYDGVAAVTRQLAAAERVLAPGRPPKTRLALLYSISSDLWQPFDYVHMLERRATYLSLVHDQYLVDMLAEQDVEAGRLHDYDVLYTADPCITARAAEAIARWVRAGGRLYGSCAAGSRNEFNEPAATLAAVFGIRPDVRTTTQPGRYRIRGGLNPMKYVDRIRVDGRGASDGPATVGVLGTKVRFSPAAGKVAGTFRDGSPAVVANTFGKGRALYVGACPGLSYIKDARFVPRELKEQWPAGTRRFINGPARRAGVPRLVRLSHPVVEAGLYETPHATALVLANFTYKPIGALRVRLRVPHEVRSVRSVERGPVAFTVGREPPAAGIGRTVSFTMPLGLNDIVLIE